MSFESYVAQRFFPITPSDTQGITDPATGLAIGGAIRVTGTAGNIVGVDGVGQVRTYPAAAGETIPGYWSKVFATNTTATGLWCFSKT